MRRALSLTLVLMLVAGMAFAQGIVGIYSDISGVDCALLDVSPGLTAYYIVHTHTMGATACQYIAAKPDCVTATWLSDTDPFPITIGSSQTGVSVGYGACREAPIHVQTINYFTMGTTPACCWYPVTCDPLGLNACFNNAIDTVDCAFQPDVAMPGLGMINANQSCICSVPVESTTWGGVKALYAE